MKVTYQCDVDRMKWLKAVAEYAEAFNMEVTMGRTKMTIEYPMATRRRKRRAKKEEAANLIPVEA